MPLKTGAVLLMGIAAGMALSNSLLTAAHARFITALQAAQCTKGDKATP
jgi:hypothetical protein